MELYRVEFVDNTDKFPSKRMGGEEVVILTNTDEWLIGVYDAVADGVYCYDVGGLVASRNIQRIIILPL